MEREISFKRDEEATEIITIKRPFGQTWKEELERLKNKGIDAENVMYSLYTDAFDIKLQGKGRTLLKGTKTKPPMSKAEVVKVLIEWEPSVGPARLTEEQRMEKEINEMSDEKRKAMLDKLNKLYNLPNTTAPGTYPKKK